MTNLGYAVEVFDKNKWENEGVLYQIDFISTHEQYYDFLLNNPSAEYYNDEIIDGITHMYYMI